jgi:hypothetical protein
MAYRWIGDIVMEALHGPQLDQALATALGLAWEECCTLEAGYTLWIKDSAGRIVMQDSAGVAEHPATDATEAFRLAMWLVKERGWTIVSTLDSKDAFVECYLPDGGEGSTVSKDTAEAICLSILEAAQKEPA